MALNGKTRIRRSQMWETSVMRSTVSWVSELNSQIYIKIALVTTQQLAQCKWF